MSIALLTQVYDEMRRLAIAGSVVAAGDFRLKKLLPPLEQAGAKTPVFGRVAEAVQAVVDAKEQTSAEALLELTTLVNAILYTQGETGAPGSIEAIETTDLGAPTSQASARVVKPLLEALTSTGGGRLGLIRDAEARGAFRDLRLVKPALAAIDDSYAEVADFVAERVLPVYGKAILPQLRGDFDLKGRAGQPRRLRLMHALDPAGTRALVKEALETGSKEVKVAAIECLGDDPEDLAYLLEQKNAKSQEVRQAAYLALAKTDDDSAVAALQEALADRDVNLVVAAVRKSRGVKLLRHVYAAIGQELGSLGKIKDKKEIGKRLNHALSLLTCLFDRHDAEIEAFLLKAFAQRDAWARIDGDTQSGKDVNAIIVNLMASATAKTQAALASTHADRPAEELGVCFLAARQALPAGEVFEIFSPYLTARVDAKKKGRDLAFAKSEAISGALGGQHSYYWAQQDDRPALDPRWLDIAVSQKHFGLVFQLARPGHAATNTFLKQTFDDVFKKAKATNDCFQVLFAMTRADHPDATDAVIAVLDKFAKQPHSAYYLVHVVPQLPKSALPRLEALLANLPDNVADSLLGPLQQLREKT